MSAIGKRVRKAISCSTMKHGWPIHKAERCLCRCHFNLLRRTSGELPFDQDDEAENLRLSIAGAQEKTALLRLDGSWHIPRGSTPTTHLFKLPMGLVGGRQADMRTSVENEWLCAQLVRAYQIPVANCWIEHFEDQTVLVVERFDRQWASDSNWLIRLPQEDFCQATGTSPLRKYQADGGPGIREVMKLLLGSENSHNDRLLFFKAQIVFWVLAATDGHAKNFSLFIKPQNRFRMTPLYDVSSAHPIIGRKANQIPLQSIKMAMAVRSKSNHYKLESITTRDWIEQAAQVGIERQVAQQIVDEVREQTPQVINQVSDRIPPGFPADLCEAICQGMQAQANRL